jgi:hypothetical protein
MGSEENQVRLILSLRATAKQSHGARMRWLRRKAPRNVRSVFDGLPHLKEMEDAFSAKAMEFEHV